MNRSPSQSGNIIIYVLAAIVLMGLIIIMVKGTSAPGIGIDAEQVAIKASEVQQYGAELEKAVGYILQNGYSETDIRFAHPNSASAYGTISSIPERQVFHKDGGGATFRAPPNGIQTSVSPWVFNGRNIVGNIGTTSNCTGASCVDLVAILPNVTRPFCLEINKRNSITNPSGNPPKDDEDADISSVFVGTFSYAAYIVDAAPSRLAGQKEGCFEGSGSPPSGTYHYYRVLLAR